MTIYRGRTYLDKHRYYQRFVHQAPSTDLGMVLTLPCHNEFHLLSTLNSLETCTAPPCGIEVLILVNAGVHHPQEVHQQNRKTLSDVQEWIHKESRQYQYYIHHIFDLPKKHAGVGLARKIVMDEAVDRLEQAGNPDGIILCLDADSQVAANYLIAVWEHFQQNPKSQAASLYFEHPTSGNAFSVDVYSGILRYELFLRYYIEALRYAGHPYAFHTIGSSMTVRSSAYQQEGGMNRKKAGEDFYFLQKFIEKGRLTELNATCVIPSPRPSDKVPFGTGRAILQWLESPQDPYPTYNWQIFEDLKHFLTQVPILYDHPTPTWPNSVDQFLAQASFEEQLLEIRHHIASPKAFEKRFFTWFNALRVLQFVHFSRDHFYPQKELLSQVQLLFSHHLPLLPLPHSLSQALNSLRLHQKNSSYRG